MTNTSMPKQNYPCPNCKYFCEDTKCCITCDNCMNSYHLKCTHLNNKVLNLIKKKNTKFICKICNDKHNCDKCDRQLSSHPKGIYCVNCLEYSCLGCLSMTNDEVHKFLTTKQPYYTIVLLVMPNSTALNVMHYVRTMRELSLVFFAIYVQTGCILNVPSSK